MAQTYYIISVNFSKNHECEHCYDEIAAYTLITADDTTPNHVCEYCFDKIEQETGQEIKWFYPANKRARYI